MPRFDACLHSGRENVARCHRIHTHVVLPHFGRKDLGERFYGRLSRRVGSYLVGNEADNRCDVADGASTLFLHAPADLAAAQECAPIVDRMHGIELFHRKFGNRFGVVQNAGRIDQRSDGAMIPFNGIGHSDDRILTRDVELLECGPPARGFDFLDRCIAGVLLEIGDNDEITALSEPLGGCLADSAGPAGDDRDPAIGHGDTSPLNVVALPLRTSPGRARPQVNIDEAPGLEKGADLGIYAVMGSASLGPVTRCTIPAGFMIQ